MIFSPPFLSGRHGYKMVISTALFGDGPARGQYMSIYICVLKGDHDDLLSWPLSVLFLGVKVLGLFKFYDFWTSLKFLGPLNIF